jgi:hypothetical protein
MSVEERSGGRTSRLEIRLVRRGFSDPDAAGWPATPCCSTPSAAPPTPTSPCSA